MTEPMRKLLAATVAAAAVGAGASGGVATTNASASPEPSLIGLCHAYAASAAANSTGLDNPAFATLVVAAGGADQVSAFCAVLLGT